MVNVRTMGSSIWHDDDDGALVDHERGLERTPSQALKRKHIGEQPQCSNAKQSVNVFLAM